MTDRVTAALSKFAWQRVRSLQEILAADQPSLARISLFSFHRRLPTLHASPDIVATALCEPRLVSPDEALPHNVQQLIFDLYFDAELSAETSIDLTQGSYPTEAWFQRDTRVEDLPVLTISCIDGNDYFKRNYGICRQGFFDAACEDIAAAVEGLGVFRKKGKMTVTRHGRCCLPINAF